MRLFEAIDEESVVIEQGEAFALNQSKEGMLLLMGEAPQAKQLIEVHSPAPDGAGPRMSLKSDGPGPLRWSHPEICIWLDASGYSAPVTIRRSSPHYSRRLLLQPPPRRCDKPGRELDAARRAGSPLARSTYCFKYASLPRGSARPSRVAFRRFRHEPSWIMRASIPPRLTADLPPRNAAPSAGYLPLLIQRR
jgi:hypothetical protein